MKYEMTHSIQRNKKNRIWKQCVAVLVSSAMLLSGCGMTGTVSTSDSTVDNGYTFGLEPVFDYQIPVEIPRIHVDTAGYLTESTKVAVFADLALESEIPEKYVICDRWSRDTVYEGSLMRKELGTETIYYGIFSDFQENGDYYIECEDIGCSNYFSIGEDVYQTTAIQIKEKIRASRLGQENSEKSYFTNGWTMDAKGNRDTRKACETVSYLLLGYEIYPALFEQLWEQESVNAMPPHD